MGVFAVSVPNCVPNCVPNGAIKVASTFDQKKAAKMPVKKLTDRFLQGVECKSRTDFFDSLVPSFGVRVSPTKNGSTKSFFVMLRKKGATKRRKIGNFPKVPLVAARDLARILLEEVQDPGSTLARSDRVPMFGEVADAYINWARAPKADGKPNKLTWTEDLRKIQTDRLPAWGDLPATSITRRMIRRLLRGIAEGRGAPISANRTQALISRIFAYGISHEDLLDGFIEINPCTRLEKFATEKPREEFLSEADVAVLWPIWAADDTIAARAHQFGLLTGLRRTEVLQGRESWLSEGPDGGLWMEVDLPNSRHTKNGRRHRIFLCRTAVNILRETNRDGFLFPSRAGGALSRVDKHSRRFRELSGVQGWTFHTLRKTMSTHLASLGFGDEVIAAILNHTRQGVTSRYNLHQYDDEKVRALQLWESRVLALAAGEESGAGKILHPRFPQS